VERPLSYGGLARLLSKNLKRTPPVAASTVLKWEQEGRTPDPWALVELARLFEVSVPEFVGEPPVNEPAQKKRPPRGQAKGFKPSPRSKPDDQRRHKSG